MGSRIFSVFKRPFGPPNAVIYSYELSKYFLDKSATSVLEVGCGIGIFALRYASLRRDTFVMGVDYSARTIEFLSSHYGKYYENLQLKTCDFCEPGLSLGKIFDAVYSSDVLEHVTNLRTFVGNIHRHLRIGGRAVVNFPNEMNHGINHFHDVADIRRLFASFSDVRVSTITIKHPVGEFWFSLRALYENLFSRSTRKTRKELYSGREEQGIDRFEDSTCFEFLNQGKISNLMASILSESCLLIKPTIEVCEVERADTNILNSPRIVVVATK